MGMCSNLFCSVVFRRRGFENSTNYCIAIFYTCPREQTLIFIQFISDSINSKTTN